MADVSHAGLKSNAESEIFGIWRMLTRANHHSKAFVDNTAIEDHFVTLVKCPEVVESLLRNTPALLLPWPKFTHNS